MKFRILAEDDGAGMASVGGAVSDGGATSSGASMTVSDNCSAGSNVINYGYPYFSNLKPSSKERKRRYDDKPKHKDRKSASHKKGKQGRRRYSDGMDDYSYR